MSGGALTELVKTRLPDLLVPSVDVIMIKGLRLGMCAWARLVKRFAEIHVIPALGDGQADGGSTPYLSPFGDWERIRQHHAVI